ncbi:glycosyltransferase family 4 protein [Candidatus Falkowbacteria bacterium]|nr:glycosyltransferase family 4 protein [Candidatus Falkowbacteria bacterium]
MRIAMLGQKGIPFIRDGGVERHVEELSVRLAANGHEVSAYVRPRFIINGQKNYKGVRLISLPSIATKNLDTITHTFLATINVLFKKVDVIHYHGIGPSTLAWIPRIFKPRAKVVVTFHSIDRFHKKWGRFARIYLGWGEWTAVHFAHKTIAVSQSIQKYCREKFKKEVVYIPNGVAVEKVGGTDQIEKLGLKKDSYILTVARLIKHKGIHYLIQAYRKMENTFGEDPKNWPGGKIKKLVIVGAPSFTDDYYAYLNKLAEQSPNIIFTGFQVGEPLKQLFANAYLYVHPSEAEGLSITILEAMSYGTCVLISNIPENMETIDHSGFSFETKNINDLYDKLVYLMAVPEIVAGRGERGKKFIKENFNWEMIVFETEKVYKNI